MKKPKVVWVAGLDDSITGICFVCRCGNEVKVEPVHVMSPDDEIECPKCGRKYTYNIRVEIIEIGSGD